MAALICSTLPASNTGSSPIAPLANVAREAAEKETRDDGDGSAPLFALALPGWLVALPVGGLVVVVLMFLMSIVLPNDFCQCHDDGEGVKVKRNARQTGR